MWTVSVDRAQWGKDYKTPFSVAMLLFKLGHAVRFFSCNGFIFHLMIKMFVNHL